MRMRKKKNLAARMERGQHQMVTDPENWRGRWRTRWAKETGATVPPRELRVELGCGKGRFTAETAAAEPEVLFVAVEVVPEAIVVAMERCRELDNVLFLSANADRLPSFFAPGEVDRIYLNFSDPWPSKRRAKRRLTHGNFLKLYREVLAPGGEIHFKTDNEPLFDFSLKEFPKFGFPVSQVTRNLHERGVRGVMTDYEAKFHAQGLPIYRLVGTMVPWEEPFPREIRTIRGRWLAAFGAGVPMEDLKERVLSEGNFLWHLFSWNLVPCLTGEAAEAALGERMDAGDECWLFYMEYPPEGQPRVRLIVRREDLPGEPEGLDGADWYVTDRHFTWTFARTHEQPQLGPYFARAVKRDGGTPARIGKKA